MRVVLDTNVIISSLNFPGNERLVLELALRRRFELCLSPFIGSCRRWSRHPLITKPPPTEKFAVQYT